MEAIAGVTARISQIQATIASLSPVTSRPVPSSAATFGGVLDGALRAQPPVGSGPGFPLAAPVGLQGGLIASGASSGTGLRADGVPADLAVYGNGRVPRDALAAIGVGGHRLWEPAAASFRELSAAAAADGVRVGVTDSYRTYDGQVDLARRKGLYAEGGLAAVPGTSDHGWGRSVDLDLDDRAQAWLRTNGPRFGFVEDVPREPWHWTFTPPG